MSRFSFFWLNIFHMKMLNVGLLVLRLCLLLGTGYKTSAAAAGKRQYQIQNGPCSYTFLLPEQENCQTQSSNYNYPVQKDGPEDGDESAQRLEQLEITMENNTQWLLKVKFRHMGKFQRDRGWSL